MIITIDTGTTNTRVSLFDGEKRLDRIKSEVGVRDTGIDGHNGKLVQAIAGSINTLKQRHCLRDSHISCVLASGMITSNLGLYEIPHLVAPAGLKDFAASMKSAVIDGIDMGEIYFIPGLKNGGDCVDAIDMMRGEEVEALAIAEIYRIQGDAIIALPGSHSKFVAMSEGKIVGCCTTLAGELISAVTHNTILASSVHKRFCESLVPESLYQGLQSAKKFGLGKTLFSIRIREQFGQQSHNELTSFLIGATLQSDIQTLTNLPSLNFGPETEIYVGGIGILPEALTFLLRKELENPVTHCKELDDLSARGAMLVAKVAGLIK